MFTSAKSKRSAVYILIGYAFLLLSIAILDQSTKFHAQKAFLTWSDPASVQVFHSSSYQALLLGTRDGAASWFELSFTYVRNTGAIWGLFQNLPNNSSNLVFLIVYPIFMALLGHTFYTSHAGQRVLRFGIACILAGAIGNFIDRATLGYVIDWMHPQWNLFGWHYSYPVFNVADASIVTGVCLWFLDTLLDTRATKKHAVPD